MRKEFVYAYSPPWAKREKIYLRLAKKRKRRRSAHREFNRTSQRIKKEAFFRANENRRNPTPTEAKFAEYLKRLRVRFIQEYVYFYERFKYRIVDFYLPDYRINIELDGGYHDDPLVKSYDDLKDQKTINQTIRFKNETVFKDGFIDELQIMLDRIGCRKVFGIDEMRNLGVLGK